MKILKFLIIAILCSATAIYAQDRKITKTGSITFEASVPSFEEVKASNPSVSCILDTKTGEIASLALMRGFHFKVALMEEHFNENFVESSKYPKAVFKGTIKNFDLATIDAKGSKYDVKGNMNLHGVTKEITISLFIKKAGNDLDITSNFNLIPQDFNIVIPKIIKPKMAETTNVQIHFLLQ